MIDPRQDPFGAFVEVRDMVAAVLSEIAEIRRARDEEKIGPGAAAVKLGHKRGYFSPSRFPWRVPHFQVAVELFPLSEWRAWNEDPAHPDKMRRAEWDALDYRERQKLLGIAS
jgi:hypothetical protein